MALKKVLRTAEAIGEDAAASDALSARTRAVKLSQEKSRSERLRELEELTLRAFRIAYENHHR